MPEPRDFDEDGPTNRPDIFGITLINAQLLADDFARNGYKTYIIDYFHGDVWPEDAMNEGSTFDRQAWFAKHMGPKKDPNDPTIEEMLDSVMEALKAEGVTRFGTTGYCFGGRFVFDLAFKGATHVSVTAHPSLLKVPEDLETYRDKATAPLLLNTCTVDNMYPPEAQAKGDEILGGGKFKPGYERAYFDGCEHGFAVRGDLSNPKVKAGKEGAFEKTVAFYKKYL